MIFCDESDKKGKFFTNFYGGILIRSSDRQILEELLRNKKEELNLGSEVKWERLSANYLEKYKEFISYYFEFVRTGRIKVRIMFCQRLYIAEGLSKENRENEYFYLYYQFLKHAFGLSYCNPNALDRVFLSLMIDELPDTRQKAQRFKSKLSSIPEAPDMRGRQLFIPPRNISEIDSSQHTLLQGLDIILGAMCSKLNDKFMIKPEGQKRRGKRTLAREKLYKHIRSEIELIYPRFNVGGTTGTQNGPEDRWHHAYRHWKFVPSKHKIDKDYVSKKAPQGPT